MFSVVLARLQTWRAIIFSRVCLSVCVCLWPAILPFSKITDAKNDGPEFWNSNSVIFDFCLLCIVKKIRLDSNKTDGGDRFWTLPLWRFRQWHCCSSTTLGGIFWLNRRRAAIEAWGRSELGAQSGRQNQPACLFVCHCVFVCKITSKLLNTKRTTIKLGS